MGKVCASDGATNQRVSKGEHKYATCETEDPEENSEEKERGRIEDNKKENGNLQSYRNKQNMDLLNPWGCGQRACKMELTDAGLFNLHDISHLAHAV